MVSKCPAKIELSAYTDGELSHSNWLEVACHLDNCPHCREQLGEIEHVKTLVGALPLVAAPNIRAYPGSLAKRRTGKARYWYLVTAAAVLLVLALNLKQNTPQEATGEYLRIHRQYEQQFAQNSQRFGELWEESQ